MNKVFQQWRDGRVVFRPRRISLGLKGSLLNMHYVYIIQSDKTHELYKGCTEDLKIRFKEHNSGRVTSTKHGVPWKIVYYEAFLTKKLARQEELFLKSGKGRERIKWILE